MFWCVALSVMLPVLFPARTVNVVAAVDPAATRYRITGGDGALGGQGSKPLHPRYRKLLSAEKGSEFSGKAHTSPMMRSNTA